MANRRGAFHESRVACGAIGVCRSVPGIIPAMTPLAKGLGLLFGAPVVLAAIFFTYFNVTGEDRIKSVCRQVTPGMSAAKLKDFIDEWKFSAAVPESGVVLLAEPKSYGRHACKVTLVAGAVKSAGYAFAD